MIQSILGFKGVPMWDELYGVFRLFRATGRTRLRPDAPDQGRERRLPVSLGRNDGLGALNIGAGLALCPTKRVTDPAGSIPRHRIASHGARSYTPASLGLGTARASIPSGCTDR